MPDAHPITRRRLLTGAAAAALVLGLTGLAPRGLFAQESAEAESREIVEMAMGDPDAPVTLVEYASLTCPHCADFHATVLPQIKANFVDTGQVRLVYREVFFDRPGLWAAMIARCAGPERYFGLIDLMYQRQSEWARAETAEGIVEQLFAIGRQAGLTDAAMTECLSDAEFAQAMVAEYQKNAAADAVEATPSFIINGEKASNMSYADFEARLNRELGAG